MSYINTFMLSLLFLSAAQNDLHSKCACTSTGARTLRKIEIRDLLAHAQPWKHDLTQKPSCFVRTSSATLAEHAHHLIVAATVAETLQHHPDITLTPTELQISIFTHSQQELTEKDATFIKKYEAELTQKPRSDRIPTITIDPIASHENLDNFLEKNTDWVIQTDNLIVSKETADFEAAAILLALCCNTPQIARSVHRLKLSYGNFLIALYDENLAQLLVAANLCSLLMHTLLPEK